MRQNLFLFLEPSIDKYRFPFNIGYTYMNRFIIDENDANEIVDIYKLKEFRSVPSYLNTGAEDRASHEQIDKWNQESLQKRYRVSNNSLVDEVNSFMTV